MDSKQQQEDWMNRKWRPVVGWTYIIICILDFALFPIAWSILQAATHQSLTQWDPLTLRGAGLFHMAMGAIFGIAAYGRTQEKLNDKAGATTPAPSFGSPTPSPAAPAPAFGSTPLGGNSVSTAPAFGSKPIAPPPAAQPEL